MRCTAPTPRCGARSRTAASDTWWPSARDRRVNTATGRYRADELAARVPRRGWQPLSAGDGAKGPREYDWAWIGISADTDDAATGHRWLLIRRNRTSGELAYYRCYAPEPVPLSALVAVTGRRWSIEANFQTAKGLYADWTSTRSADGHRGGAGRS